MPWTPETPYILQSIKTEGQAPDELFHRTEDEQRAAFEKDKTNSLYIRLWRGKGNSEDRNTWDTFEEWSRD